MIGNDMTDAFDGWLEELEGERLFGSYVNGRWNASTPAILAFNGVVQNANTEDLQTLQEGDRASEAIKIHTTFSLEKKDLITYMGIKWLVYNVARRYIGNYNKAIAIKQ
jgi:hypothetical protein